MKNKWSCQLLLRVARFPGMARLAVNTSIAEFKGALHARSGCDSLPAPSGSLLLPCTSLTYLIKAAGLPPRDGSAFDDLTIGDKQHGGFLSPVLSLHVTPFGITSRRPTPPLSAHFVHLLPPPLPLLSPASSSFCDLCSVRCKYAVCIGKWRNMWIRLSAMPTFTDLCMEKHSHFPIGEKEAVSNCLTNVRSILERAGGFGRASYYNSHEFFFRYNWTSLSQTSLLSH